MTEHADELVRIFERWAVPPADMVATIPRGNFKAKYVGHADITRILIESDPHWSWEPVAWETDGTPRIRTEGKRLILWGRLTVLGKSVICCGTCEAAKPDPEKELIGDLLRNGAMRFGICLSLWSKDEWTAGGDAVEPKRVSSSRAPAPASPPVADLTRRRVDTARARMNDDQKAAIRAWMASHDITLANATPDDLARLADECDRLTGEATQ